MSDFNGVATYIRVLPRVDFRCRNPSCFLFVTDVGSALHLNVISTANDDAEGVHSTGGETNVVRLISLRRTGRCLVIRYSGAIRVRRNVIFAIG